MNPRTQEILGGLMNLVKEKKSPPVEIWLRYAQDLTILLLDEEEELAELNQQVAIKKLGILNAQVEDGGKKNVSSAEIEVEASDLYKNMRKHEALIKTVIELVRIAKKRGTETY